jgi:RHS repeat-associated protein
VAQIYGDANHKHAVTSTGAGSSFTYDANGDMIARTVGGQAYTLTYDAENHLTSVSGAATATFVYDGDGARVKATINGTTIVYVGNYFEWNDTTSALTKYYYAGNTRIAVRGTYLRYLLTDHLGSTTVSATGVGDYLSELRYKPWGETRYSDGATPTKRHFQGQIEESTLGLYFFNARWVDPVLGRFAQADTLVPEPGNPQAWDRYAFVYNNPIRYSDPTGNIPCIEGYRCQNNQQSESDDDLSEPKSKPDTPFTPITSTNSFDIQDGGTSSTVNISPYPYFISNQYNNIDGVEDSGAFMYGFNISGSYPGVYMTGGMEE